MGEQKTDFLRFNAYSIKDLITRKLSENSKFTDQVYEGSNLAILIDLVSYMYQCLVFQLNNAASESMFQDTQIYENINRLVNLIGYNPRGCYPAAMTLQLKNEKDTGFHIPKFTYFDTGMTDRNGVRICFSQCQQYVEDTGIDQATLEINDTMEDTFYNGMWRMLPTIFTASGIENETFELGLNSDGSSGGYVPGEFVEVYVVDKNGDVTKWNRDDDGVFANSTNVRHIDTSNTTIYGKTKKIFGIRLTENKTYEIKFGSGIVGSKPENGDRIIVFYLDTNGPDGQIDLSNVDFGQVELQCAANKFGLTDDLYSKIIGCDIAQANDRLDGISIEPASMIVSNFKFEESVEEIKENGPSWFKLGNRLITRSDYEYFIKNNESAKSCFQNRDIADVRCMNNIEYVTTFYKWLYQCGITGKNEGLDGFQDDGGRHYFNPKFWQRTDYKYIDPADANNTYLWVKTGDMDKKEYQDLYDVRSAEARLNKVLQPMKTLTTEIQVLKPVIVNFDICAARDRDYIRRMYMDDDQVVMDPNLESYIEVTIDDNTLYVSTAIQSQIVEIITDGFNVNTCKLGQNISYAKMLERIYRISGIERVRTIFKPLDETIAPHAVDGLSFMSWSPVLDDGAGANGIDLEVGNSNRHILDFQFPRFIGKDNLMNRIRVIKKSLVTINTIKM